MLSNCSHSQDGHKFVNVVFPDQTDTAEVTIRVTRL